MWLTMVGALIKLTSRKFPICSTQLKIMTRHAHRMFNSLGLASTSAKKLWTRMVAQLKHSQKVWTRAQPLCLPWRWASLSISSVCLFNISKARKNPSTAPIILTLRDSGTQLTIILFSAKMCLKWNNQLLNRSEIKLERLMAWLVSSARLISKSIVIWAYT